MDRSSHWQIIESKIEQFTGEGQPLSPARARHALDQVAQVAFREGENYALLSLMTVRDVAVTLRVSERRVRAIARERHERLRIGWQVPGTSTWLFRPEEIELLRPGTSGRPRKD